MQVYDSGRVYAGVDAAGNFHLHVLGHCYTNDEIYDELSELLGASDESE